MSLSTELCHKATCSVLGSQNGPSIRNYVGRPSWENRNLVELITDSRRNKTMVTSSAQCGLQILVENLELRISMYNYYYVIFVSADHFDIQT